jgi:hypothetical protein
MKNCNKCFQSYPETSEYWRFDNGKLYRKTCLICSRKKTNEYQKQYYIHNKSQCLLNMKQYRDKSKDKLNTYYSEYYKENKEHIQEVKRKYKKKRYQTDPEYRLRRNISRMITAALKQPRKVSCLEKLDYSITDLKSHLESKFIDGMTWENYGEWQIDHIIPQSKLIYSSMEDENFKKCWSLDNLQPLWKIDNQRKSNK